MEFRRVLFRSGCGLCGRILTASLPCGIQGMGSLSACCVIVEPPSTTSPVVASTRSEESREGKEWVRTSRPRWASTHSKKKARAKDLDAAIQETKRKNYC